MKNLAPVLCATAILVSVLLFSGGSRDGAFAQQKPGAEPQVGRYQVIRPIAFTGAAIDCLLDTATGKVWQLKAKDAARGDWVLAVDGPK